MRHSGTLEQHSFPPAAGRKCQLLACAPQTGGAEVSRRPLLARTSALIRQRKGRLSAYWLASPHTAFRAPGGRRQACRHQPGKAPGKVAAVAGTRQPARAAPRGYSIDGNFRLQDSEREEYRARVAERKERAVKPLPGSPQAEAVIMLLKSGLPPYVKDAVLVMGLSAYLDFTDIAAKVGYTRDWEATEVPLGPFFRKDMSEDEVQAAQEAWLECLFSLPIRQLRGSGAAESRSKKKSEAPSKGLGGAAVPKGFGGGEARPSRGRKKKGAASAVKKPVKSQGELLYELEVKARAREREKEQQEWSEYVALLESHFGPMTDDDVSVWMGQRAFWDVADDLFRLAVNPFVISGFMGCSMEYCVRLLRSLRFAYVVSMPRRLRDTSEAPEAPKAERVSQGQNLLSGVGTALRDALSFRKGAAAASTRSPNEKDVTLSDVRQLSQQEQDQGPLDRLEMADRMSVPAELTAATPSIRVMAIAELMSPGFRWWQERGVRLRGESRNGMSAAVPDFPMDSFPENILVGRDHPSDSPAADVSGIRNRDGARSSPFAQSPADSDLAQPLDRPLGQSLGASQAHTGFEEELLGASQQASELEAIQGPAVAAEQPAEAVQASMQAAEQAAERLQATLEQPLEASQTQADTSELPLDAFRQVPRALEPSTETPQTASQAVDQSCDTEQLPTPLKESLDTQQQEVEISQAALQAPEQAAEASVQSPTAEASDRYLLEAADASAQATERVLETLQQADAQNSATSATPGVRAGSAGPARSPKRAREASERLPDASQQPPELSQLAAAEDRQGTADQQGSSAGWSTGERPAHVSQTPSQPQLLRQLGDRFRDTAEELAQLDASAIGPRARRPPAARSRHPRSRDGWTSLPEQTPDRDLESQAPPARAPAVRPASMPSPPWQPRIRVQPPAFHEGAYMAPQLLPGDRRDWKAAGVLAYTVDERGVYLLLGKIDQRLSYLPPKRREEGWWILGGKRTGADYSAEATAVREMFEETAGILSGRDVSGGQLSEVLWYPDAGYALFPLYIPGKPNIPRAYNQKLAARESLRRRMVRRVAAGPRDMSALGWVPLKAIMERRCKLHMVLDAMLRRTPLIPYLQQMQQLISERVALQVNPVTLPPGASYRGPTPVLPKNLEAPISARVEDGSSSFSRGRPPHGEGPYASKRAGAATERRSMAAPARMHPSDSYESVTKSSESPSATPAGASASGSAADRRRLPAASPAAEAAAPSVARAANGSIRRLDDSRPVQTECFTGHAASNAVKEDVLSRALAELAKAGNVEEAWDSVKAGREMQREMPPWEQELNSPKPYKSAIIRRGRRRLKRRVS